MKILTVDDFDPVKRVENYRLYLKAEGLKPGDKVQPYGYQLWISKRAKEFRQLNGLSEWDSIMVYDYEKYMDYLRICAGEQQLTLF